MTLSPLSDRDFMLKLARMRMPYGKYRDMPLVELPEPYVVWMHQQGFPDTELGRMLGIVYEIKVNGLEHLFAPLSLSNGMSSDVTGTAGRNRRLCKN
ncbi:MAG: DUF3820 family protein [Methylotenera sp.]|nr:DUF3820 family protein [Oligoflexia bacterium]